MNNWHLSSGSPHRWAVERDALRPLSSAVGLHRPTRLPFRQRFALLAPNYEIVNGLGFMSYGPIAYEIVIFQLDSLLVNNLSTSIFDQLLDLITTFSLLTLLASFRILTSCPLAHDQLHLCANCFGALYSINRPNRLRPFSEGSLSLSQLLLLKSPVFLLSIFL